MARHTLKIGDIMFHNVMAAYSSGDHMMQLLPFMAMAEEITLHYLDDDGSYKTTSLYDAYTTVSNRDAHIDTLGKDIDKGRMGTAGKLGLRKDIYYVKEAGDVQLVQKLQK